MRWRLGLLALLIYNVLLAFALGLVVGFDIEIPAWVVGIVIGVSVAAFGLAVQRRQR